jgi:hypothetical protein
MNKIDLIIDALESAYEDKAGWCDKVNAALYAARDLQALRPVAWLYRGQLHDLDPAQWSLFPETATPLYALDEETK